MPLTVKSERTSWGATAGLIACASASSITTANSILRRTIPDIYSDSLPRYTGLSVSSVPSSITTV